MLATDLMSMIVWRIALLAVRDAADTALLHMGGTLILQQTIRYLAHMLA